MQAEPPGLVADEEPTGLRVVEPRGSGKAGPRPHDGLLGEPAVGQHRPADDPVTDRETLNAGTDLDDLAAQLDAGGERQVRAHLVEPVAHQGVGEVGSGREDSHP